MLKRFAFCICNLLLVFMLGALFVVLRGGTISQ